VNLIAMEDVATARLRFVDDNPRLLGTYFPGIPVPVEDRASLLARPPDEVIVMSRTFGPRLAAELRAALPPRVDVISWDALFA